MASNLATNPKKKTSGQYTPCESHTSIAGPIVELNKTVDAVKSTHSPVCQKATKHGERVEFDGNDLGKFLIRCFRFNGFDSMIQ